jgi:hypothetical protein
MHQSFLNEALKEIVLGDASDQLDRTDIGMDERNL